MKGTGSRAQAAEGCSPLSTEQLLLLNNLMYMTSEEPLRSITAEAYQGKQICDVIESIDIKRFENGRDYGSYMTGGDWKQIFQAIRRDERLMQMTLEKTNVDLEAGGGGGVSALFTDPAGREAVVCYRGTASGEWKDNFIGGGGTDAPDGVSTLQQRNALRWYESLVLDDWETVTVTGHSKGGNKAKYVTLLDSSVDRCVAFDGQGFSDEFIEKYRKQISENQRKIRSCNVEGDYVNLLLNDVGSVEFYKGWNIGAGGFLENHCPNTFLKFSEDGSGRMVSGSREPAMKALDQFLNSYLRSIYPAQKKETLLLIGTLVEAGFHGAQPEELANIALRGKNPACASRLLAYLAEYERSHPDFAGSLEQFLEDSGMKQAAEVLRTIDCILDWKGFGGLVDGADWLGSRTSDESLELLAGYIAKKSGLRLRAEELRGILNLLHHTNVEAERLQGKTVWEAGEDLAVGNSGGYLLFAPGQVEEAVELLMRYEQRLSGVLEELRRISGCSSGALDRIKPQLFGTIKKAERQRQKLRRLKKQLQKMSQIISAAEKSNQSRFFYT